MGCPTTLEGVPIYKHISPLKGGMNHHPSAANLNCEVPFEGMLSGGIWGIMLDTVMPFARYATCPKAGTNKFLSKWSRVNTKVILGPFGICRAYFWGSVTNH